MPPLRSPRRALRFVALSSLLGLLTLVAAPSAGASPGKEVKLTMAPSTVPAGGSAVITATFENPVEASQQLGSVNLEPPAGLTVTDVTVDRGTRRFGPDLVELRNLALAPDTKMAARITVQAPCAPLVSPLWTVTLKQANDFKGAGNAMSLTATSTRSTAVSGSCKLDWTTQPADAREDALISGTPYTAPKPPDVLPVGVAFVDGEGNPVKAGTDAVTLSVAVPENAPAPQGNTSSFSATTGIASFGGLNIGSPGTYQLRAKVTSGPLAGVTSELSSRFRIDTVAVQCLSGVSCSGTLPSGQTTFGVNALAGPDAPVLTLSLNGGVSLGADQCDGWVGYTANTALFEVTSAVREKRISLTVDRRIMNVDPDNGAPSLELCFGSPEPFDAKAGSDASVPSGLQFDWDRDGDLDAVYTGLLADCAEVDGPCVTQRKKVSGGNGYIEASVPAKLGDPLMRG